MRSERLISRKLSAGEVSKASKELIQSIEAWRERDLSQESIKYMFVAEVVFSMRIDFSIEKVAVLIAIGFTEQGNRTIVGLQAGDRESASNWREFLKDLKRRGLDRSEVSLGIMGGLPGLESLFTGEFPNCKIIQHQIHIARNVLAKVPSKVKKTIADGVRSLFYASSRAKP